MMENTINLTLLIIDYLVECYYFSTQIFIRENVIHVSVLNQIRIILFLNFVSNRHYNSQQNIKILMEETQERVQNLNRTTSQKIIAYIATLIAIHSLVGIIGAYSVIRPHINRQHGIQQDILGTVDALSFLGRFFGIIYQSIYPSNNPKLTYLLNAIVISILLCCIPLITWMPNYSVPILMVSFFFMGFARAIIILPFYMVHTYFTAHSKNNQILLGIWMTSIGVGDLVGVAIVNSLIQFAYLSWQKSFLIFTVYFLFSAVFMFIALDQTKGKISPNNLTEKQAVGQIIELVKQKKYLMLSIDVTTINSVHYTLLLWVPYYLESIKLSQYNILVTAAYVCCLPIGSGLFGLFQKLEAIKDRYIVSIFLFLSCAIFFTLLILIEATQETEKIVLIFTIFIALGAIFIGGPLSYVFSNQPKKASRSNLEHFWLISVITLFCELFKVLDMALVGVLMKKSLNSFLYVILLILIFELFFNYFRNSVYPSASIQGEAEKEGQLQQKNDI